MAKRINGMNELICGLAIVSAVIAFAPNARAEKILCGAEEIQAKYVPEVLGLVDWGSERNFETATDLCQARKITQGLETRLAKAIARYKADYNVSLENCSGDSCLQQAEQDIQREIDTCIAIRARFQNPHNVEILFSAEKVRQSCLQATTQLITAP